MPIYVNGTMRLGGTVEATPAEGDLWYDSGKFNFGTSLSFTPGAWSSGGNLGTARYLLAGAGTQSAGLCMGGVDSTWQASVVTEAYDGTSWSAGGDLGSTKTAGCGTQSAGLSMGGYNPSTGTKSNVTEEYDGTSWSSGGNLANARWYLAGAGTQTAGLCMGGYEHPYIYYNATEEYDGTSWSAGGDISGTNRYSMAGAGTQSAGLCMGGSIGDDGNDTITNITEEYNGTSWSSGGNVSTARMSHAGAGTQSSGLCMGGSDSSWYNTNTTEEYNPGPGSYEELFTASSGV